MRFNELVQFERENLTLAQAILEQIRKTRSQAGLTRSEIHDLDAAQRSTERVIQIATETLSRASVVPKVEKSR